VRKSLSKAKLLTLVVNVDDQFILRDLEEPRYDKVPDISKPAHILHEVYVVMEAVKRQLLHPVPIQKFME
jgi:hypothetical protein